MNKDELIALDDRGIGATDTHDVDSFAAMFADDFVYTDDTVQGTMTSLDQVREYMSGSIKSASICRAGSQPFPT
jgi:hypothetical protein